MDGSSLACSSRKRSHDAVRADAITNPELHCAGCLVTYRDLTMIQVACCIGALSEEVIVAGRSHRQFATGLFLFSLGC